MDSIWFVFLFGILNFVESWEFRYSSRKFWEEYLPVEFSCQNFPRWILDCEILIKQGFDFFAENLLTIFVVLCSMYVVERNTENIAYKNMLYICSINPFRPSPEDWQYREKSSSNYFELDCKYQKTEITNPSKYINQIQQVYYLELWCRL